MSSDAQGKLIVLSAPSGSGKSTLVSHLMKCKDLNLAFSISATSRTPRNGEIDGRHYHFLSIENFREKISKNAFIEYEEVYPNHFYGTLRSEVSRIWNNNQNAIFDIDVIGGLNIKGLFPSQTLSVFIKPPSIKELRQRLETRNADSTEKINMRVKKAQKELEQAHMFDAILENDNLETAKEEIYTLVSGFLKN